MIPGPPDAIKKGVQKPSFFDLIKKRLWKKYLFATFLHNIESQEDFSKQAIRGRGT